MRARTATPKKAGPKPRTVPKKPLKLCAKGHRQSQRWKPEEGCTRCQLDEIDRRRAEGAVAERTRWVEELGPPPEELTIRCGDGGLVVAKIPRGLRRRPGLAHRARRR